MLVIKRNKILIIGLFILVLTAGIFNVVEQRKGKESMLNIAEETIKLSSDKVHEMNVKDDKTKTLESGNKETKEDDMGLATLVSSSEDEFFLEAKINRDETRAERKEWLMDMINTSATTDNSKENAMNEIYELQDKMECEMQIESLIEAKGFGNTYVRIDDDQIDIIVAKQNLSQNDISQIVDIVTSKTKMKTNQIKIAPLKMEE